MKNEPNTAEQTEKSLVELLDDLHELVAKAEAKLKKAAGELSEESVACLRERCARAQAQLGQLFSETRKQCVDKAQSVEASVRAKPYQSLAIAAGIALLCGLLARRKRPIVRSK